jgi:RimJ/RimL family protein N-acetyltransferase
MHIETERLKIRSFVEDDIRDYAVIVADARVTRYLADGAPHRYEEARSYILDCIARDAATGISRYAVLRKAAGDLIGFCGFRRLDAYVDFGWRYAHRAWGHGYGTEAALAVLGYGIDRLALRDIAAGTFVENVASLRIIRKLGFEHQVADEYYGKPTIRYHRSPVSPGPDNLRSAEAE